MGKAKTIKDILAEHESVARLTDESIDVERIPTGILDLDKALDGGFPVGKMIELYGPAGAGKSAVALYTAVRAQERGSVLWMDLEGAFNPEIASRAGLRLDDLFFATPNTSEEVLDLIKEVVEVKDIALVVVDSVAGMVPRAEVMGDAGDSHVGLQARLMSQGTRRISNRMQEVGSETSVIWVNQIRDKIGAIGYGPQTTTTGGRALEFWCSTRVDVTRIGQVKQGEEVVGHKVRARVTKSRFSRPMQKAEFQIIYESGISNGAALVDTAIEAGVITKKGSWLIDTETGETLAQGAVNLAKILDEDGEAFEQLLDKVTEQREDE